MRRQRKWVLTALAAAITLCLSACMGSGQSISLAEAKKVAIAVQDDITAAVPEEYVASRKQESEASLLSCGDRRYTWTGRTTLTLRGNPDPQTLINMIDDRMSKKGDFKTELSKAEDRTPQIQVISPTKGNYMVVFWHDYAELQVITDSPCFSLPDGVYPGGEH